VKKGAPEFVDALPPAEEGQPYSAEVEDAPAMLEASVGRAD
jgi:hypothetical protein